jgi:RNA polymerase sigma-70 factor (ECF subfamily)
MRAWLFRIMHNSWIAAYRARQSRPEEVLCDVFADWQCAPTYRYPPVGMRSAETEALELMCDARVSAALNRIPQGIRLAVYYADVEGYRYREIAAMMGIPIGTVMSRLARGRRSLRTMLTDHTPS